MGNYLTDLLGGATLPYPSAPNAAVPPACGVGEYKPTQKDGLLRRLFAPEELPYPSPSCTPPASPAPTPAATPVRPTIGPTPSRDDERPKIPIALMTAPSRVLTAHSTNPKFTSTYADAHEEYLEEELGEVLTPRMSQYEGDPIAFVVPDGCDAVELYYGPIEPNPGVGLVEEAEEVVTFGRPRAASITGRLVPGEAFVVVVPWRAASWLDIGAAHLRVKVAAHFYKATA